MGGYSLGFGFFAVIQSVLIILYSKFVLNTLFVGDWWLAMIFMLLIAIVAVTMGMFVSIVSKTEFRVVQAIPILIVPQIFFDIIKGKWKTIIIFQMSAGHEKTAVEMTAVFLIGLSRHLVKVNQFRVMTSPSAHWVTVLSTAYSDRD